MIPRSTPAQTLRFGGHSETGSTSINDWDSGPMGYTINISKGVVGVRALQVGIGL